jgi:hypothetical protein
MIEDAKIHFQERRHDATGVNTFFKENVTLKGPVIVNERRNNNRAESIVLGESGKVHFEPTYGLYQDDRLGKKQPPHLEYSGDILLRGKKYLTRTYVEDDSFIPGMKQFHGTKCMLPSETSMKVSHHWTGKTRAYPNETGMYDLEGYMNRKQRIPDINTQRNGIPIASGGDKYYKEANYQPGFYKEGGLIPGSSMTLKKTGKPTLRKRDDTRNMSISRKSTMTFKEKQMKAELDNELNLIATLNNASEKMQQRVPSWEERTGAFLVRPEDEKY